MGRIYSSVRFASARALTDPLPSSENPSGTIREKPPGIWRIGFGSNLGLVGSCLELRYLKKLAANRRASGFAGKVTPISCYK